MSTYSTRVKTVTLQDINKAPTFDEDGRQLSQKERIIIRLEHYGVQHDPLMCRGKLFSLLAEYVKTINRNPVWHEVFENNIFTPHIYAFVTNFGPQYLQQYERTYRVAHFKASGK